MEALIIPAASLVSIALLLGWLAHAAAAGELERNGLIGLRTKSTMDSDAAWEAGHRAAGPALVRAAWSSGTAGVAGTVLAIVGTWAAVVAVIAGYLALIVLLVIATTQAGRAARGV